MTHPSIKIAAIVAMAKNGCIGDKNDLPWHIPEDLKHFKEKTSGKPILMGRKTFESILDRIGKPLPKRKTYIISRSGFDYQHPDVSICASFDMALEMAKDHAKAHHIHEVIIGGGTQIYELALPVIDKIYLTEIDLEVNGDSFFPELYITYWT